MGANLTILLFVLLTSKMAYSLLYMSRCQSVMGHLIQQARTFQTDRRLRIAKEGVWEKRAQILRRMLKEKPEPRLQIKIADTAGHIPKEGLDILKEMIKQYPSPAPELQEAIVRSIGRISERVEKWKSGEREQAMTMLEEFLDNNNDLQPTVLEASILVAAEDIGGKEGFYLLKKIYDKYPSLKVNEELFAYMAHTVQGEEGVGMFKERLHENLSPEEQEIYAFYAGKMEGPHGLEILKLLEEQYPSNERLKFAFLTGKTEAYGLRQWLSRSYDSGGDFSGIAAAAVVGM